MHIPFNVDIVVLRDVTFRHNYTLTQRRGKETHSDAVCNRENLGSTEMSKQCATKL